MSTPRKHYSAPEKVAILRLHLLEKKPVSDLCDQHGIHPTSRARASIGCRGAPSA